MVLTKLAAILLLDFLLAVGHVLSGTVTDSEGAAISRAHVIVHRDSSDPGQILNGVGIKRDITTSTDESGKFSMELPSGFYDVFVTATAFTPHAEKIRMKGKAKAYRIKLKISEMVINNLD